MRVQAVDYDMNESVRASFGSPEYDTVFLAVRNLDGEKLTILLEKKLFAGFVNQCRKALRQQGIRAAQIGPADFGKLSVGEEME